MLSQCIIITIVGLDESDWPGVKCQEGGRRQSPIDIRTSAAVTDFDKEFIRHGDLKFTGYSNVLLTGLNNGHTIQFSTEGEKAMHPILRGGPLEHSYRLEQLHFHWISEHAINGHKFPLEIHFVHIRSDLSVQEALNERDGLAVVSVFSNVVADLDNQQFEQTQEFMQHFPGLAETGARASGVLLDATKLLSPNLRSYYTYAGSLTSPECNEVVIWIIFDKPILISDSQYRAFGKVSLGRHNFRHLQSVKWQRVFRPPPASVWTTPYIVHVFSDVYRVVANFVRNVTSFVRKAVTKKS